ncbi:MAG: baseplate J/gp47 family protein [Verrucomicrobiota bacterium]|nr:baseplate J/gp47 family protein [Verrucomicrobiota bacterium]
MTTTTAIDLSKLPAPSIVEMVDYEVILAEMLSDLRARDPQFDALVESDPAYKILQVAAYREVLLRQRVNDAAKACMLAYATGANLDNLSALYGVERLSGETDTELRLRTQLSLESLSVAGPSGAYKYHALTAVYAWTDADGLRWEQRAKDVSIERGNPGQVVATVLAAVPVCLDDPDAEYPNFYNGSCWGVKIRYAGGYSDGATAMAVSALVADIPDGTVIGFPGGGQFTLDADASAGDFEITGELVGAVADGEEAGLVQVINTALSAETVRPLCDTVKVRSAVIVEYSVNAELTLSYGPDASLVLQEAISRIIAYIAARHRVGYDVPLSGIITALSPEGVQSVALSSPDFTTVVDSAHAAWCRPENVIITVAGRND